MSEFVSFVGRPNRARRLVFWALLWVVIPFDSRVFAQESKSNGVGLIPEPIEYTDIIDAFVEDDSFDLNLGFGYQMTENNGTIWREERASSGSDGHQDIAEHTHSLHQLVFRLEVGLYRDLMFYTRMPVVISDRREIKPINSDDQPQQVTLDSEGSGSETDDVVLFELPFTAAIRSGIPQVDFGLAWGITNQFRTPHLPTWVILLEGRFSFGKILKPSCQERDEALSCNRSPGITEGYHAMRLESRTSYRYRFLEPYLGLACMFQWAGLASYYFLPRLGQDGARTSADEVDYAGPPDELETVLGVAFVPWEDPTDFRRFVIDLQANAVYVTSGRDRSPLFDVLGTSKANELDKTQIDMIDPDSEGQAGDAPFYGLTDVQSHARFTLRTALTLQTDSYLRFRLGVGIGFETAHLLTATDKCVGDGDSDSENADPRCPDGGAFNRNYREAIDRAGQRFGLGGNLYLDVVTQAIGTF